MIMAIIPFGLSAPSWDMCSWGWKLRLFSLFGMVALTGVVVNDSIVLIDFINHRLEADIPIGRVADRRRGDAVSVR